MPDSREDIEKKLKALRESLDATDKLLFDRILKGLQNGATSLAEWNAALSLFKTKADQLSDTLDYVGTSLSNSVNELAKGNEFINRQISSSRQLRGISEQLLSMRQGESNYDLKKIKKLEEQAKANYRILDSQLQQLLLEGKTDDKLKEKVESAKLLLDQFDELKKEAKEFEKSLGVTGVLLKGISKIPIVGPLLEVNEALDAARKKAKANGNAFQVMGAGLGSVGKSLISNLFDPLVTIGLTVKIFKELLDLGFRLDKQVVSLQKAFYLSRVEAKALQDRFQNITDTNNVLVKGLNDSLITRKNQVEAAIQLSNVMGAVGRVTDQEVQSQIKLTKQMGLSVEEGQALYVLGRQNKMTSSEVVDEITKQVKATQKQHGFLLDTKKVTQDVSKITGQLRLQYGNNVKQLASAVIQSNKLGFSLEQTKKIAEGLLNFEESIENELSAELLIGRDLNLEQARLLALNGKSAEATALIAQNMGGSAGFAAMNVIQQEALAKALGMNADELANSILYQENLGNLKEEDKKRLEDEIGRLKERGELEKAQQLERAAANGADIESAIESINKQDEFNTNVEKIKESLEGLLSGPAFQLAEWVTSMVKNSETLQTVLKGVAYIVGGALLVSLGKALVSMSALVLEAIAYAVTWAIANPIAAAAGAIIAGGIAATISSEISSAKSKNKPTNPNYATGGIVGGSSLAGDNMKINANSGEMVLNRRQQANLFKLANGGGGGGPIQVTVYGQIDKKTLFTFMAEGERTNSNNLASERQLNNRPTQ
jgi:hypothetical protein